MRQQFCGGSTGFMINISDSTITTVVQHIWLLRLEVQKLWYIAASLMQFWLLGMHTKIPGTANVLYELRQTLWCNIQCRSSHSLDVYHCDEPRLLAGCCVLPPHALCYHFITETVKLQWEANGVSSFLIWKKVQSVNLSKLSAIIHLWPTVFCPWSSHQAFGRPDTRDMVLSF